MAKGRSKYSESEKRAYWSGQSYKLAQNGKAINFKNAKNKESFCNGYRSIDPSKYPDAKSKCK